MSALKAALQHPANHPLPLVSRLVTELGVAIPAGLTEQGGLICDFRPGWEEQHASLSVSVKPSGTVFKRFSGDGFQGGAVAFVESCLGLSKAQAAQWLIKNAGMVDQPTAPTCVRAPAPSHVPWLAQQQAKVARLKPLDAAEASRTLGQWQCLTADSSEPAAAELGRRGLLGALTSGLLRAFAHLPNARLPRTVRPGALMFEVRGPDGLPYSRRVRNPGDKASPDRYVNLITGQGIPAWCNPAIVQRASSIELWIEGELSGVAVAYALHTEGHGHLRVQGVGGAGHLPHLSHLQPGDQIFIYADPDREGNEARKRWQRLAEELGLTVTQLPTDLFEEGDACDTLKERGTSDMTKKIIKALSTSPSQTTPSPSDDCWVDGRTGYGVRQGSLCTLTREHDKDGTERIRIEVLTTFTAFIVAERRVEKGSGQSECQFQIEGYGANGGSLGAPTWVSAAEFNAMAWPVEHWGAQAILHAGPKKKDQARVAIQLLSKGRGIKRSTCYGHTGWIDSPQNGWVYLSGGATIGAEGAVPGFAVELPGRLASYALPVPENRQSQQEAVRASLKLLTLAPDEVAFALLGAVYRAVLGRMDATVWLVGPTNMNKTSLLGLIQAHFGPEWNRTYLPDGWNSSSNALEGNAHLIKDAVFLVDDFKPGGGTNKDNKDAHDNVTRLLQGVADGQGRGTMTRERQNRAALYPRGTLMSSAEQLPRGHSNRARAVIIPVSESLIGKDRAKSNAFYAAADQAHAGIYAQALSGYLQVLAGPLERIRVGSPEHKAHVRALARIFEGDHGRTGAALGELSYGWRVFLSYAVKEEAISSLEAQELWQRMMRAFKTLTDVQSEHLLAEDPSQRAIRILADLLAQGRVYLSDKKTGGVPVDPELCGWEWFNSGGDKGAWTTKLQAQRLGWVAEENGKVWAYLLPDALLETLHRITEVQRQPGLFSDVGAMTRAMQHRFYSQGLMHCQGEGERLRSTVRASAPTDAKDQDRGRYLKLAFPFDLERYGVDDDSQDRDSQDALPEWVPLPL